MELWIQVVNTYKVYAFLESLPLTSSSPGSKESPKKAGKLSFKEAQALHLISFNYWCHI